MNPLPLAMDPDWETLVLKNVWFVVFSWMLQSMLDVTYCPVIVMPWAEAVVKCVGAAGVCMFWNCKDPLPARSTPPGNCTVSGFETARFPLMVALPSVTDPEAADVAVCVTMYRVALEATVNCPLSVKFSGITARVPDCTESVEPRPAPHSSSSRR